jgi:glyceraldehyde 3-phosphate dehydrogenase
MVFRAAIEHFDDIQVLGVNDLLDPDNLAYLSEFESVKGDFLAR